MSAQRDPLLRALDRINAPVRFFVRDDDAGWADEPLLALLHVMHQASVPIDLAAIPAAVTPGLAGELRARQRAGHRLGVHQHGFSHLNHEPAGRKCEFGAGRHAAQREADLRRGRETLIATFDGEIDDIFTPPWNRVSPDTPQLLAALGYEALSRDATAPAQSALPEIAVHTDWTRHWRAAVQAQADPMQRVSEDLARHVSAGASVGLMLHHAEMPALELECLRTCLLTWRVHPYAQFVRMKTLVEKARAVH
jgi:predicted deacetylase